MKRKKITIKMNKESSFERMKRLYPSWFHGLPPSEFVIVGFRLCPFTFSSLSVLQRNRRTYLFKPLSKDSEEEHHFRTMMGFYGNFPMVFRRTESGYKYVGGSHKLNLLAQRDFEE